MSSSATPTAPGCWCCWPILLFGAAWAASRSLITNYGIEALGLSRGKAGGLTLPSGVAFLLAAYPLALLSERIGRLRVMALGMTVFVTALIAGTLVHTATATIVALCVAAVGAAGFVINAAVVLWNLAPSSRVLGTYTALYTVGWAGGRLPRAGRGRRHGRHHRLEPHADRRGRARGLRRRRRGAGAAAARAGRERGRAVSTILVTTDYTRPGDEAHILLTAAGHDVRYVVRPRGEALVAALSDVDGAIIGNDPLTAEVLERAPRLRAIVRSGVGYDSVDVDAAARLGITSATSRGSTATPSPSTRWGCCWPRPGGWSRRPPVSRAGDWPRQSGRELRGATLGLIGYGPAARAVVPLARAFGMRSSAPPATPTTPMSSSSSWRSCCVTPTSCPSTPP